MNNNINDIVYENDGNCDYNYNITSPTSCNTFEENGGIITDNEYEVVSELILDDLVINEDDEIVCNKHSGL